MPEFNEELIVKYINNTLSEHEERILLEWLQLSDANREILLTYKKIAASGKIGYYSNPVVLDLALNKFNKRTEIVEKKAKQKFVLRLTRYAALIFLITGLAFFATRFFHKDLKQLTVSVDKEESIKKVSLPDGTIVWINNGSSLTYPDVFNPKTRTVYLKGEAFFEVKTDSLHPFFVKTGTMFVKVYGTSFNVNTNTSDNTIKTTLVTGRVTISDSTNHNLVTLLPGQLANFNKKSQEVNVSTVNPELYISWREGLVVFDKANLASITKKIEEIYHVQITINSKKELQNKINFVFRKTHKLDTVMEMLEFVAPIDYKKFDNQIYINLK